MQTWSTYEGFQSQVPEPTALSCGMIRPRLGAPATRHEIAFESGLRFSQPNGDPFFDGEVDQGGL